ncbi:V-set and immunoglobulin domain-containing protein 1 [Elgaria multicarinata webbii]|uniref:V-set and immunoglobulin domain-containing protein 1 n=1 Tax=Elgaria multicarinata webbii TaxID=159646 RepID=UPI002FCD538C
MPPPSSPPKEEVMTLISGTRARTHAHMHTQAAAPPPGRAAGRAVGARDAGARPINNNEHVREARGLADKVANTPNISNQGFWLELQVSMSSGLLWCTIELQVATTQCSPVSCITLTVPQKSVNTTVGGNITLLCTYQLQEPGPKLLIQWSFYSARQKNSTSVYYSQSGVSYTSPAFKGRIQIANSTGNATLTIFNMQSWETGIYTCEVLNPGGAGGQSEKSISVSVLVAPSKPICSFGQSRHPEIEFGHMVTLFCFSNNGLPNPTYQWHRLMGDTVKPVTELYDPQTGSLVIGNLTKFEEGYYQCTASNSLGNSTCQIDLTTKHSESGIIIAALIAAILAAALICIIVWIVASKETKKKRKEKAAKEEVQITTQKEPLTAEYAAVPSQESVPVAAVPSSKESNETNEYVTPEEIELAEVPENEMQETEHQPIA